MFDRKMNVSKRIQPVWCGLQMERKWEQEQEGMSLNQILVGQQVLDVNGKTE